MTYPNRPVLGAMGVTALIAAGAIGVAVSGTASGSLEPTPTTVLPSRGVEVQAEKPSPQLAEAVSNALPAGAKVTSESIVHGGRADYVDLTATDALGGRWGITVYRSFDSSELDHLEATKSARGTTWIGAEDPDLMSIYLLNSTTGVGVWIGHGGTGEKAIGRVALEAVAHQLTIAPAVMAAAT